jgi:parallel beta-helix repeat protein
MYSRPICALNVPDSTCICSKIVANMNCIGSDLAYDWSIIGGSYINNSPNGSSILLRPNNVGTVTVIGNVSDPNGGKSTYSRSTTILPNDRREVVYLNPDANLSEVIARSENKTLCLEDGTYAGGIVINKKNIKIKSRNRLGARIVSNRPDYSIVLDNTSDVDIEGLDISGSDSGVILFNSTYCDIENCSISFSDSCFRRFLFDSPI